MKRTELREQVFKLLFRVEFNSMEEMTEQENLFIENDDKEMSETDAAYIKDKYEKIADKLSEIDEIIRLALYEIKFDESVPTGVAINEAVELAKKFGQDESPAFVNGVLAKFA